MIDEIDLELAHVEVRDIAKLRLPLKELEPVVPEHGIAPIKPAERLCRRQFRMALGGVWHLRKLPEKLIWLLAYDRSSTYESSPGYPCDHTARAA
jgi:hypothetical protein